jgi:hypothetical protein
LRFAGPARTRHGALQHLCDVAEALDGVNDYGAARTAAQRVVILIREVGGEDAILARALARLAKAERRSGSLRLAMATAHESVTLWRDLVTADSDANRYWLAEALLTRSIVSAQVDGATTARRWAQEALDNFIAAARRDPSAVTGSALDTPTRLNPTTPHPGQRHGDERCSSPTPSTQPRPLNCGYPPS